MGQIKNIKLHIVTDIKVTINLNSVNRFLAVVNRGHIMFSSITRRSFPCVTRFAAVQVVQGPSSICSLHTTSTANVDKNTEDKTPLGRFSAEEKLKEKEAEKVAEKAATEGDESKSESEEPAPDPYAPFPNDRNPETGETGGPRGPEPTRYGDWERKGRVTDF